MSGSKQHLLRSTDPSLCGKNDNRGKTSGVYRRQKKEEAKVTVVFAPKKKHSVQLHGHPSFTCSSVIHQKQTNTN